MFKKIEWMKMCNCNESTRSDFEIMTSVLLCDHFGFLCFENIHLKLLVKIVPNRIKIK